MADADLKLDFGGVIRALRRKTGLSQEAFASRCGLHRTYVSDIERGERNVSLENIERLAKALDMSISGLFAEVEKQSREAHESVPSK